MSSPTKKKFVQQHPVNNIKVWLKVFIPDSIPGITKTIRNGPTSGLSYIPHPASELNGLGYLTDGRSFDSNPRASARATIPLNIYLNGIQPRLDYSRADSNLTHEVDLATGKVTCEQGAQTWISNLQRKIISVNGDIIRIRFSAEPANPCSPLSERIAKVDIAGIVEIDLFELTVGFEGTIAPVPAYEMYAQADNGPVVAVFQCSPEPGADFSSLVGVSKRRVRSRVDLNHSPHRIDGKLRRDFNWPLSGPGPRFTAGASCP